MAAISERYAFRDPDPERARRAMCNKIGYVSRANARRTIKNMGKKRNVSSLQVYKCAFCAFWHIGNKMDKAKKKALTRRHANDRTSDGDRPVQASG